MAASRQPPSLLTLPQDLLLEVLRQPTLRSRELCRLERCCSTLRKLTDDRIWKESFMRNRRCNVLREPENWKRECADREGWSNGWRDIVEESLGSSGAPRSMQLKFQLLVGKVVRAVAASLSLRSRIIPIRGLLVVDAASTAAGTFKTIAAALAVCNPFDIISIQPGCYHEQLLIEKPIELVGAEGGGHLPVLTGADGPTISVVSRIGVRIAKLCIEQNDFSQEGGNAMTGALLVKGGASVVLEDSVISSETGHCVVIQGADSRGFVCHNMVRNGKGVGILICDLAKGLVRDNDISCNGRAGVAILGGADPHVCANKIHKGKDSGVLVSDKGRGRIEENEIFSNARAGVAILKEAAPLVKGNRIHGGCDSGVLVCENGMGEVVCNDIFGNRMAGVAMGSGGASSVTRNTIRGNGGSLCLSLHSKGFISANVIHNSGNSRSDMQVPARFLSEVRSRNTIQSEAAPPAASSTATAIPELVVENYSSDGGELGA